MLSVLLLSAVLATGECQFNVNVAGADHFVVAPGQPYTITWSEVPGAVRYRLTETPVGYGTAQVAAFAGDNLRLREFRPADGLSVKLNHFAADDAYFGYNIIALDGNDAVVCSTNFAVLVHPDATTKSIFHRLIVPVAGSAVTADGSKFHTSLRLTTRNNTTLTGRVVFHPQGAISENDPAIPYRLEGTFNSLHSSSQSWDDVVATIGASGIGSLDIVPDDPDVTAPEVEARAWNDKSGYRNGGRIPVLPSSQLLAPSDDFIRHFVVANEEGKYRTSVGFRTYGLKTVAVRVYVDGHMLNEFVIPPNTHRQMTLEQLANGPVADGSLVTLTPLYPNNRFDSSLYIYYTLTDNSSNDPSVFLPGVNSDTAYTFQSLSY